MFKGYYYLVYKEIERREIKKFKAINKKLAKKKDNNPLEYSEDYLFAEIKKKKKTAWIFASTLQMLNLIAIILFINHQFNLNIYNSDSNITLFLMCTVGFANYLYNSKFQIKGIDEIEKGFKYEFLRKYSKIIFLLYSLFSSYAFFQMVINEIVRINKW